MSYLRAIKTVTKSDFMIVGGGALDGYCDIWHERINEAVSSAGLAIGWGFGFNSSKVEALTKVDIGFSKFDELGTRDFKEPHGRYLPCVSCMSEFFGIEYEKKRKTGVVAHKETALELAEFKHYPDVWFFNNSSMMHRVIRFIGESEQIISGSYHIQYWAHLLNVPCYTLNADDIRISGAEFKVDGSLDPGFYDRCVEKNTSFSEKVFSHIKQFEMGV